MVLSAMSRVMNTTRLLRSSPSGQASSVAGGWKTCCQAWVTSGLCGWLDVLHAVDHDRLVGVLDVQDALHAQEVGAAIGHQRIERRRHRRPAHRLVEGH